MIRSIIRRALWAVGIESVADHHAAMERLDAHHRQVRERLEEQLARMLDERAQPSAATGAPCPRCGAPAGERCRRADGSAALRVHAERRAEWLTQAEETRDA